MVENNSSKNLIENMSFCVFDLETTGGDHKNDKIIEIGLVKIENLKIVDEKDFLIQPEINIPEFIQKLTTITPADVEGSPIIEDVIDDILTFMGDSILVAHNTSFDIPFFNSVLKRLGREPMSNKALCTNLMTKYLIPNLMNSNLHYMSKIFGIKHKKAHRALDDARATATLLIKYLKIFIDKGITKPNHLYYPRNRFELDQLNFKSDVDKDLIFKKLRKIKSPFLITFKGENGIILFSYPSSGTEQDYSFIERKIVQFDYQVMTVKLYGPLIECLVHFANHFNKLEVSIRQEIITFLWKTHIKGKDFVLKNTNNFQDDQSEMNSSLEADFLITNHLVPDQYIIYPISFLGHKTELVFRYPAHKKKLLQYINSRSHRMDNNKMKKLSYHIWFRDFLDAYLEKQDHDKSGFFLFKKEIAMKNSEQFFLNLENFLEKNPNPFNYPKEYI
jgi:DNA polymerase III subunit epsilon